LAPTYAHISSDDNYDLEFLPHKTSVESAPINFSSSPSPLCYILPISEEEVRWTISQCSKNSAPGHDQIPTIFLQKLHPNTISFFTSLLNRIFQSSTFPTIWEIEVIIPILKPYKDGPLPHSYRPISLLCTLSKIFEKILNKRLIWFLESYKQLAIWLS